MKEEYDTIRDEGGVKVVILEEIKEGAYVYSVKVTYTNEHGMERDFEAIAEDFTHAGDLAGELARTFSIL